MKRKTATLKTVDVESFNAVCAERDRLKSEVLILRDQVKSLAQGDMNARFTGRYEGAAARALRAAVKQLAGGRRRHRS